MTVAAVGQFCELKLKLHDDKYTPRPKSSSALIFSDDVEKCVFCWLIRQKLSLFYCNKIVSRQPCSSTRLHRHMQRTAQAVPGVRQRVHFIEFQLDRRHCCGDGEWVSEKRCKTRDNYQLHFASTLLGCFLQVDACMLGLSIAIYLHKLHATNCALFLWQQGAHA